MSLRRETWTHDALIHGLKEHFDQVASHYMRRCLNANLVEAPVGIRRSACIEQHDDNSPAGQEHLLSQSPSRGSGVHPDARPAVIVFDEPVLLTVDARLRCLLNSAGIEQSRSRSRHPTHQAALALPALSCHATNLVSTSSLASSFKPARPSLHSPIESPPRQSHRCGPSARGGADSATGDPRRPRTVARRATGEMVIDSIEGGWTRPYTTTPRPHPQGSPVQVPGPIGAESRPHPQLPAHRKNPEAKREETPEPEGSGVSDVSRHHNGGYSVERQTP